MRRGRVVLLLAVLLVTLNLGNMAVNQAYTAPGPLAVSRNVVIPPDGTAAAARVLRQDGAINYPFVFRLAAWLTRGEGAVRAGEFFIPARSSLREILGILRFGAPVEHQVTIPEGLTGIQIAKIINAAADATGVVAVPAEGSVLPQTYAYIYGERRAAILARAAAAMQVNLKNAWAKRDATIPLAAPEAAVSLASIVQQETPLPAELPEIAAVYENRLRRGMKLQADPTVIYAVSQGATSSGLAITKDDLSRLSPYNTYVVEGLPPGPICAPGLAALQAVLHPALSKNLYFVATGNGGHVFASNFQDQLANIAAYRNAHRHGEE